MKEQERLDRVLAAAYPVVQDEIRALTGADFSLSKPQSNLYSKQEVFELPDTRQILAKIDITGEIEGEGGLLISIKDAVRLGGILIMLPETEVESFVKDENYSEEIADSYGEIANIIVGAYSKNFEEMFPQNFRLIRKEQEPVSPFKVDAESDQPIKNQNYYTVRHRISINETEYGELILLLPALTFGLVEAGQQDKYTGDKKSITSKSTKEDAGERTISQSSKKSDFDARKHKDRVDRLLESCRQTMQAELGSLIGTEIALTSLGNKLIGKEEFFFDELSGKQVLAHIDIAGDENDQAYFFTSLKDAVRIGGTLIMLPTNELENAVSEGEYTEDIQDAYGEAANIIAGVYNGVFENEYTKKIRFIRKELENLVPMKVDVESAEPMPDIKYYLHALGLAMGGKSLGNMFLAVPARVFQLEDEEVQEEAAVSSEPAKHEAGGQPNTSEPETGVSSAANNDYDVIIIGNDEPEKEKIKKALGSRNFQVKELEFKDNIFDYINDEVKAVFLVMQDVNELGFGMAIKISSSSSCPLIAASPAWTKSKVIKAVKYGVNDILLTPASEFDIDEKLEHNLVQLAA